MTLPAVPLRVLIVDDHVDSAESLAELLRLSGYDTRLAHEGRHAVQVAHDFRPQVVLLDIALPGIDGLEVARRIRATEWGNKTLLVAVSGWGGAQNRAETASAGFDHHLVKPVDLDALDKLMSRAPQATQAARAA